MQIARAAGVLTAAEANVRPIPSAASPTHALGAHTHMHPRVRARMRTPSFRMATDVGSCLSWPFASWHCSVLPSTPHWFPNFSKQSRLGITAQDGFAAAD